MPPANLLVVEDDPTINQALTDRLIAEGFFVHQAFDGPAGVAMAAEHHPDAVILDIMLPGFDGLEVCRRIQATWPIPVLMLTARDDETDMIIGLGLGADDYVTKPFRMREVVARVHALLRRVERARTITAASDTVAIDGLSIDRNARRVHVDGTAVHLTPIEFDLLVVLIAEPGAVRSHDDLMRDVWGWPDTSGTRTLASHIKALRAKIGAQRVRTVHGVGYAFEIVHRGERSDGTMT